jgi:hypothetical protein
MSKRLQVLLSSDEYLSFQSMARAARISLGEWVRQVLRKKASEQSAKSPAEKLKAIRKAYRSNFPTADIDQMLREIESGYLGE